MLLEALPAELGIDISREVEQTRSMLPSSLREVVDHVRDHLGYWLSSETPAKPTLTVQLKYYEGRPVIERLERISRPGLRIFRGKGDLPKVRGGLGVAIVSTSNGVMSDREARAAGHGGEVLCVVE